MVERTEFRPNRVPCLPLSHGPQRAEAPAPGRNRLLAALPAEVYDHLLPDLEPFALPLGSVVQRPGERSAHVHFITSGIVSRMHVTEHGETAEFALTGREGVIGVASFLGGGSMTSHALVLCEGHSYRLPARLVRREFGRDGPLPRLLLRYTLSLIAQTGQISACNRRHSLQQRLCRWLLSCLDRLPANELLMTHALIAEMLGVRREGVSESAGILEDEGVIQCGRSHIAVIDRSGLEARACECHAILQDMDDGLLPGYRTVASCFDRAPIPNSHRSTNRIAVRG